MTGQHLPVSAKFVPSEKSGSRGSADQICLTSPCPLPTRFARHGKPGGDIPASFRHKEATGRLQTFWAESALSAIEGEAELHLKTEAYPESRQDTQSSDLSGPVKVATPPA